jgi:uncharacterized protein
VKKRKLKRQGDRLAGIYIPQKTIRIPLSGLVDVSGMLPIISHHLMQILQERKQLTLAHKVFPGAVHSRLEHSLGTLQKLRKIIRHFRMTDIGLIHALEVYAIGHDIGHGPFSHEIELITGLDHEKVGEQRLMEMRKQISQYADFDLVLQLFRHEHPLSPLVHDKNFGADKLDYLQRDAHHVGYELGLNDDAIISYLQFQDGIIGVDMKSKEEMMAYQFSYLRMYNQIYFNKTVKIFARMLLRVLSDQVYEGFINLDHHRRQSLAEYLFNSTDAELVGGILSHPLIPLIKYRQPHKTAVVFKIAGYEQEERRRDRHYPVHGIEPELLGQWSKQLDNPEFVLELEQQLEAALKLRYSSALIVQPNFYDKIIPHDILLYNLEKNTFTSLFRQVPSHPHSLQEVIDRAFYIRVVVNEDHLTEVAGFNFKNFFKKHIPV